MFGYSRQGYYKRVRLEEKREKEAQNVLQEVKDIRKRQPRVGAEKLQSHLSDRGIKIGRDRLFTLLRLHNLLIRPRRRYVVTTNSRHWLKTYKNEIGDLVLVRPGQVYVSDITYIDTDEGFAYLSLITDAYSRKIVGCTLSDSLGIEGSMKALRMALKHTANSKGLIHHSDRGIQYCSKAYVGYLKKRGVTISMTEINHAYENALAERVNGILKNELGLGERLRSYNIAKKMVKEAVEIYNNERLHKSIDLMTPAQKHAA